MNVAASQAAHGGGDRLEQFRGLRARLDPAGAPERALVNGLYVEPVRSVSARLAAELMLSPASTHLLIGGIGSGKTTELIAAARRINEVPDSQAFCIDVSRGRDVAEMPSGSLVVQVGLAFGEGLLRVMDPDEEPGEVARQLRYLRNVAFGYWEDPFSAEPGSPDMDRVPGILDPHELETSVADALRLTSPLLDAVRARWQHPIVLLDGLDRMTDMVAFERLVEEDLRILTSLHVGVVLVGPLKALYGIDRTVVQRFDQFHYQPWIDAASAPDAELFLTNILRRRAPEDALDGDGLEILVRNSGGVLRDLLSLAQSACVEAYLDGSDVIGARQTSAAIDSFGRKHMQGLRPAEVELLQRLLAKGSFVQTSEDDLALLMTRRVLEYRDNGRPRYAVHPTLVPFLRQMASEG